MVSKTVLLLVLVFATILLITSEIAAAKNLASNHDESEVEDAKYGRDDRGYYNGGRGGNYNNGGGYNNRGGRRGNYCRYGCCGGGRYYNGCRCCTTLAEAAAYKQAAHDHAAQTHN
uniref:glycine-rich protein 3 short isoform-like n=1 Tax=Erigeron canadensis TaxID=72917 RepID=UPI001CB9C0EC|nr:glycine-rich protein 3 short isoform-like [Erigeron canadensis]